MLKRYKITKVSTDNPLGSYMPDFIGLQIGIDLTCPHGFDYDYDDKDNPGMPTTAYADVEATQEIHNFLKRSFYYTEI